MVARIQIRGEEGVTTGKSGSVANHRALQLESPPFARTYEKLYAHFSSSISTPFLLIDLVSRRKTMEESFSLSFIVCHGYRMHYWLFILVEERKREGEYSSRSKRSEIEPADQIL